VLTWVGGCAPVTSSSRACLWDGVPSRGLPEGGRGGQENQASRRGCSGRAIRQPRTRRRRNASEDEEKQYQRELRRLHGELVAMQARVKASAAKVCVVFEGRDTAGEGRHHQGDHPNASARGCSVPSPCPPPPNASSHRRTCTIHTAPSRQGEVVIFDRSWYNRGGVERVMGFCPPRPGHPIPATGLSLDPPTRLGACSGVIMKRVP
jgi:polyphosphate kinase 2 (PPK2 family)